MLSEDSPVLGLHALMGIVLHRGRGLAGANAQALLPAQGFPAGCRRASICSQVACQSGPAAQSGHTCCGGAVPPSLLPVRQCLQAVCALLAGPVLDVSQVKWAAHRLCMGMAQMIEIHMLRNPDAAL